MEGVQIADLKDPDYVSAEVSAGLIVGATFILALDRYGEVYFSAGWNIGKSPLILGGQIMVGELLGEEATQPHLLDFMTGWTNAVSSAVGPAAGFSWNDFDFAFNAGIGLGLGFSRTHGWDLGDWGADLGLDWGPPGYNPDHEQPGEHCKQVMV